MFSRLKSLFSKPASPDFLDSELGVLTLDCGVWIGTVRRDERELRFVVAGTNTVPDAALLGCVRTLLERFPDVEHTAIGFLRNREPTLRQARLDFYSFEFLWEDKVDNFAFEFLADGHDSRVWRVEFVHGQPSQTGFDD